MQDAWDSYIQNSNIDLINPPWSAVLDVPASAISSDGTEQVYIPHQQQSNSFDSGGVYMEVNTPGNIPM